MSGDGITPASKPSSWKLAPGVAVDTQALVVSGFNELPAAVALLLHAERPGGAWLRALLDAVPITPADGKRTPCAALAFTSTGLQQLGAPTEGFAQPFREGMLQQDRRRRLGDGDKDGGLPQAIAWSANAQDGSATPDTVHALLLLYDVNHETLVARADAANHVFAGAGVQVVKRIPLDLRVDPNGQFPREHFGFADGISQPIPYGEGTSDGTGATFRQDPLHGVPLGEVLLGYPDAHGQRAGGPLLRGTIAADGSFQPQQTAAGAAPGADAADAEPPDLEAAPPSFDLGRNGSYLVVRELRQDVAGFWSSMEAVAKDLNERYPERPAVDAAWIAERIIGRTRDGHVLCPVGSMPPRDGGPDNDFLFFLRDPAGYGCPSGSHVRRANPRDGLAYQAEVCEALLHSANAHRLMRRGRKFGGDVATTAAAAASAGDVAKPAPAAPAGDEGLLFMCLNGDLARQFEFVQQNWMLNPNFATLFDEVDPLVGPASPMSLPDRPIRRRIAVDTYVTLAGGDYFFLPSLSALRVLAALRL